MAMPNFTLLRKLAMPIHLAVSLYFIVSTEAGINLPNNQAANELCKLALAGQKGNGKTKPAAIKEGAAGHWYAWHDAAPLESSGEESSDVKFRVWHEIENCDKKIPAPKILRCTIVCAEQEPDSTYKKPRQCVGLPPLIGQTQQSEFSVHENHIGPNRNLPKLEVVYTTVQVNTGINEPKKRGEQTKVKHTIEYQMDCINFSGAQFEEKVHREVVVKEEPADKKKAAT